jgi:hypothetical protein
MKVRSAANNKCVARLVRRVAKLHSMFSLQKHHFWLVIGGIEQRSVMIGHIARDMVPLPSIAPGAIVEKTR